MPSSNTLSQAQTCEQFLSSVLNAPVARKVVEVQAFEVEVPMHIVTLLKDGGFEGAPVVQPGDFVIVNPGGEMYPNSRDYFQEKYDHKEGNTYQAKGLSFALEYTGETIHITSPWNAIMPVEAGDYLVCPQGRSEVYRIARDEFNETYVFID